MDEMEQQIAMAKRYREYLTGHAYIPLQDRLKYERCFKKIYHNAEVLGFDCE